MADAHAPTATEIVAATRAGTLTVEAVVRRCLARVAERDDVVHAWSALDPDLVVAQARALDALPAERRGPLHGVPVGIKDIVLTADLPTQYNSPHYAGFHPRMDASCVALLRHAGAVIFGKTDTVEFGATGRRARTVNPHAPGHTPGGSSSGSAAAVADGHVPLALGTQTGGSMIRPASYCGTWAIKPTWGFVGRDGVRPYAPTLDTIGWFARSTADLRLLFDVFDPDAPAATPAEPATDAGALRGATIAAYRTPGWSRAEAATRDAFDDAIARLRDAGATVVPLAVPPMFDALPELQLRVMRSEARATLLADHRLHPDTFDASLRDQVLNTDGTTPTQCVEAYDTAARCRETFDRVASAFDAVLAPSTTGAAPAGLANTGDLVFNGLWSLLHAPCVAVPGWSDAAGLPVGLTLTGPRYADRRVLGIASAWEALMSNPGS